MSKSGLSPQLIMRASLTRHIKEISKPADASTPSWQTPESQQRSGESEIENLGWAGEYAEPGYTAGERGILTANWNYFTRNVTDILERAGFECEWSDEWSTCDECGKLVRTSPDCYDWQRSYIVMNECEIVCLECVNWEEYLETIEDSPSSACMRACDPGKFGYQRISQPAEYENGFHPGQNDDPEKILAALQEKGHSRVIFRIPETSQFYITFEVWEKIPEAEADNV